MRPDPKAPRRSGPCPRIRMTQKHRGHGPLLPGRRQRGFGLVAAMFLIIVIAGAIAAMWRISTTQTATSSLALQQARAYQAARAGLEWGISSALGGACAETNPVFTPGGFSELFRVHVSCSSTPPMPIEEEGFSGVEFLAVKAWAEYGVAGSPDYTYREIVSVLEKP